MLQTGHFTFPPAIGAVVGPGVVDESVTAANGAFAQYQNAANFTFYLGGDCTQRIKSILNHDCSTSSYGKSQQFWQ
jgi:hypothetical protein